MILLMHTISGSGDGSETELKDLQNNRDIGFTSIGPVPTIMLATEWWWWLREEEAKPNKGIEEWIVTYLDGSWKWGIYIGLP